MNTKCRKYLSDRSCFVSLLTWKERKGFNEMRCWSPATLPGFMCLFGTEVKRRINLFISAITMERQDMSKAQDRRSEQGVNLATICVFLFLFRNVGKHDDEKSGSFSVTTWIQHIYGLIDGAHLVRKMSCVNIPPIVEALIGQWWPRTHCQGNKEGGRKGDPR